MNRHAQLKELAETGKLQPPAYGEPQRDGINALIDGGVLNLSNKIDDLTKKLESLRDQAIHRAADAKALVNETISVMGRISGEADHLAAVIAEIEARGRDE